ncbi:MAG: hypothetical protein H6707_17305 [Deltaproteobacteria bacterium]|nr:hypothetical protein [Deltaproteobacteria bacterium]
MAAQTRLWLLPAALALSLSSFALLWAQGFHLVDDAYISFRYAQNLAAGHGLTWNIGQPVEGYTNLLWVVLLTPFAALAGGLVWPSIVLGWGFALGALFFCGRLAQGAYPGEHAVAALAALLLALNPSFAYWATSGMETALFTFLVCGAILALQRRRLFWAALALNAAYLTRPEGALVAALLLLGYLLFEPQPWLTKLKQVVAIGASLSVVIALHVWIRMGYYGYPLPNTFYAKVILGKTSALRGLSHLWAFALAGGLLLPWGLIYLRERSPAGRLLRQGYLLLGGYLIYLATIGGDLPSWYRFYLPLLPVPLIGLARCLTRLARGRPARLRGALLASALAALGVLFFSQSEVKQLPYVRDSQRISKFLVENFFRRIPPGSYVAAFAVGRLAYETPLRILDGWGLNDVHIAHLQRAPSHKFAHDKQDWRYLLSRYPDYIYAFKLGGFVVPIPGYQPCWPTRIFPKVAVYRRIVRLPQPTVGMPHGLTRDPKPPPVCDGRPRGVTSS